ncbi:MAG: alpha-mannosyltransferase [Elusimicrobia bacterium CG_4_10_14_0_2_um_filter_63_34]|nr:MAG: alpha-mannosyltransferase [Elusimicrobia bacterium CG_4_10_14_0_2_um_filter_63_34]
MQTTPKRYRTIWLSDIHLGTRGCKADYLLDFLKNNESDRLYLVGDIIDGWALKKSWYWPQAHNDVIQKVLRKARKGTKVVYVPGNHDEGMRDFLGLRFGGVRVVREAVHKTADGRRLLVIHGDQFDGVVAHARIHDTRTAPERASGRGRRARPLRVASLPCPGYPEIRLAVAPRRRLERILDAASPDAVHLATEGPLGLAARRICLDRGVAFTTAFHTRFPDYVKRRTGLPVEVGFRFMRWFHRPASRVLAATPSLIAELEGRGFENLKLWSRGVDAVLFRPRPKGYLDLPHPILLNVGRVAVEKNLEAFLGLEFSGTKVVVGDGPSLPGLKRRYPGVRFLGAKRGEELARCYADADAFVFPSRTDFGLVLLEALASGVPVAAFPVAGPRDAVTDPAVGCLDEDLGRAVRTALSLDPERCREYALSYSWASVAERFAALLEPRPWYAPPDPDALALAA